MTVEVFAHAVLEEGDVVVVAVNGLFGERMCEVAARCGAEVVGISVLMELDFLAGREQLGDVPLHTLLTV